MNICVECGWLLEEGSKRCEAEIARSEGSERDYWIAYSMQCSPAVFCPIIGKDRRDVTACHSLNSDGKCGDYKPKED